MINKTEEEIMRNWVGDINNPLVSIRCTAYNHEQYIRDALNGFLIQETTFPFEVIVHDDASTDNTTKIIKEYENKYPNIIKPIYETENQYSKHDGSFSRIINEKIKGKYIAFCEGDDYWINKNKLQMQIEYLESHSNCKLVLTNNYSEDNKTKIKEIDNPYPELGILSSSEVIRENKTLPATCSMIVPYSIYVSMPSLFKKAPVGDIPLRYYAITLGYAYYFDEVTCVYRKNSVGSFSLRVKNNKDYAKHILENMLVFYDNYDKYTNYQHHDDINYAKDKEHYYYYFRINNKIKLMLTNYYKNNVSFKIKIRNIISLLIPVSIIKLIKRKNYEK